MVRSRPLEVVSSGSTTIISDYIVSAFNKHDAKWLVQVIGNVTINNVAEAIRMSAITVDRHYIFLVISHNQLRSVTKSQINLGFRSIVDLIRQKNKHAKIFISALLPRPIDNKEVKPLIIKFNRALAVTVNQVWKQDPRVLLLTVQHDFVKDGQPLEHLYAEDRFMLNEQGVAMLKKRLFKLAGFTKNK